MEFMKDVTVLSLEQATVLPYLTYRLAYDVVPYQTVRIPINGMLQSDDLHAVMG